MISVATNIASLISYCCDYLEDSDEVYGPELSAGVALQFCNLLRLSLSDAQTSAIALARLFWSGEAAPGFDEASEACANECDRVVLNGASSDFVARSRLIWAALNTATPFDAIGCGYLLGWARDAGIALADIKAVMEGTGVFR